LPKIILNYPSVFKIGVLRHEFYARWMPFLMQPSPFPMAPIMVEDGDLHTSTYLLVNCFNSYSKCKLIKIKMNKLKHTGATNATAKNDIGMQYCYKYVSTSR
jgi:hypothetical protein